jgi:hypothetical protein
MFADPARFVDLAYRPLFALVQCREYLQGTAKALALVPALLLLGTPVALAGLSLFFGFRRGGDGTRSSTRMVLGVVGALPCLGIAFVLLVFLAISGALAPCAPGR